jgi:hypothetical protein
MVMAARQWRTWRSRLVLKAQSELGQAYKQGL